MVNNNECAKCGGKEIKQGKQSAQGKMVPIDSPLSFGSSIISDICTNCGHILESRVEKPEKFK